jgi:hypothetical protein
MGRRSPSNERYQKFTSPAGKTRKSAAAAKPKRAASSPGKSSSASKKKVTTKGGRPAYLHPSTPEYKRLRLIWWGFLGGAMALSTASWFLWKSESLRTYGNIVLTIAYASIAIAIYIDWAKLRPLRQKWLESGQVAAEKAMSGSKSSTADSKPATSDKGSSADKKS